MTRTRKKTTSKSKKKGMITQRMLYERKRENELFTALAKRGWEFQIDVAKDIYNQYCTRIDFRIALNRYIIKNENANQTLQTSFEQLPKRPYIIKILVFGEVGSGKSRVARKVVRSISNAFGREPLFQAPSGDEFEIAPGPVKLAPVTFTLDQTRAVMSRDDAPGAILHQDEMPEMRGENSKRFKQDMTNLMKVSARAEKIHFVFVNPELIVPFKLNWVIEVLGANYSRKLTLCMLYYLTRNTLSPVADGVLIFNVDEPDELTSWYEEMAIKNKRETRENAGTTVPQWTTSEQDVHDILDAVARAGGISTRGQLEALVKKPESNLRHVFNNGFMKDAVTEAWAKIKAELDAGTASGASADLEYTGDIDLEFQVDEDDLLRSYPNQRDVEIYRKYQDPRVTQDDLASEFNLDQSTIARIAGSRGEVTGWVADQVGLLFEKYLVEKLQLQHPGGTFTRDGRKSKPDIRGDLDGKTIFYSVKCYNSPRKGVSIPVDELAPEIDAARKFQAKFPDANVQVIVVFHNRATGMTCERDVDFTNPPRKPLRFKNNR